MNIPLTERTTRQFKSEHPSVESIMIWPDGVVDVIYHADHEDAADARRALEREYIIVQDEQFFGFNVLTLRRRA